MNNITVIIPVHEYNDEIMSFLNKAIQSVVKQEKLNDPVEIIIVHPPNIEQKIKNHPFENTLKLSFLTNIGNTDYQSQVNLAVKQITTDYFTVLEFDDEFSLTYFSIMEKYIKIYSDIDIFMSMIIEVNEKNEALKLTNESVWAQQLVGENGELGYLNMNVINQHTDFKLSGAVIKKQSFIDIGQYKSKIKLTFMYELLLRALNNACKIFTIPKIGYKHFAIRENSMFDLLQKNMPLDERKFWFEIAKSESHFSNDRDIDISRLTTQTKSEE